jgi:RNA polymerase sigma-70 factor (ECF subfamily)
VFIRVFARLGRIRDAASVRPFVTSTTVFVAREAIRRRSRRRWLVFSAPEDMPEIELPGASDEVRSAVGAFYETLARLPIDERVAFSLRYVEGMELTEIAWATETSLSTVKRRLRAADDRFTKLASVRSELVHLLEEGNRWPALEG